MSDFKTLHDALCNGLFAEDPFLFNRIISRLQDKVAGEQSQSGQVSQTQTVSDQEDVVVQLYACLPDSTGDYVLKPWHLSLFKLSLTIGWLDISGHLSNVCWKSIDKSVEVESLLNYFLNSSILQFSTGKIEEALLTLNLALSIPGTIPSVIQIAAMRKLCFFQLIYYGDLVALPSWVGKSNRTMTILWDALRDHPDAQDHAMRYQGSLASTYRDLLLPSDLKNIVKAFRDDQEGLTELDTALHILKPKLTESGDWPLAEMLPSAMKRRTLERISLRYASVKTDFVARICQCESGSGISQLVGDFNSFESKKGIRVELDSTGEYMLFSRSSDPPDSVIEHQYNRLRTMMTSVLSSVS